MDIVDKKYVDDRDITSITSPDSISSLEYAIVPADKSIIINTPKKIFSVGISSDLNYINKRINITDDKGMNHLLLIANADEYYATKDTSFTSYPGFTGFMGVIHDCRTAGYPMPRDVFIIACCGYKHESVYSNTLHLYSSHDLFKPCVVKYQEHYYIAISITGSGRDIVIEGTRGNLINPLILLHSTISNKHLSAIDGVEYVDTEYCRDYYPMSVSSSKTAELANSVKDESINVMKLDMQARRPYIHNGIDSLNNIDYDAIFNLVWNTYGTNGNQAMPTIGIVYTTNNNSTTEYNRQLMYNPNLGTFQYRNKATTSNTWDDWTPIPIPQTTILHKSYLQSAHIDALTVSGFYVLTNNSAINYSTMSEFIVVHNNSQGQVFQTHYGGNGNIKGRVGNLQSDGTIVWNNWIIKTYTYNISHDNNGMYRFDDFTNSWLAMTTTDFTNIINNLQLPNIKCKCRVKHDTNNYSTCDVKLYKQNSFIMSYFDFDTNQTVYIKVWLEGDVIKTNKKTITFES